MRLFKSNLIIVKNENKSIVYNAHSHSMVRITNTMLPLLHKISSIEEGNEFSLSDFYDEYPYNVVDQIFNSLINSKIIFLSQESAADFDFKTKYRSMKKNVSLKIAYIHLTQRCNLECDYCYNKHNLNITDELDTEQMIDVIRKLDNVGVKEFVFTGGEPFLRNDLKIIVDYASSIGDVTILTNGTLLQNLDLQILKQVKNIIVSLDSVDEVLNAKHRHNSQNYSIIENIKNITEEHRRKIIIRSVITNDNIFEIDTMKEFCESQLKCTYRTSIFLPNSIDEITMVPNYAFPDSYKGEEMFPINNIVSCGGCTKEIAINSNGDVYPCQNMIKEGFKITNIHYNNEWYSELANSKITDQFIRNNVSSISVCSDCEFKYVCGGGCRAIAYNVYGDLGAHLEFFCDYLKQEALFRIKQYKFCSNSN